MPGLRCVCDADGARWSRGFCWTDPDPRDPTVGFTRAGTIGVDGESLCGAPIRLRAQDQQTGQWSDWLDHDPGC